MAFTLLVVIFDTFMMPVVFLIAGYVLRIQVRKYSMSALLANRMKRLAVPWVLCTLLFAPYLSCLIARETGNDISYVSMIIRYFWTDYYSQGPYWFLGILLSFTFLLLFARKIARKRVSLPVVSPRVVWGAVFIMSFTGYMSGSIRFGVDTWVNPLHVWSFQPSRIMTYFSFFVAGYLFSSAHRRFTGGVKRWSAIALVMAAGFVVMKGKTDQAADGILYAIQSFFYAGLTLSVSIFLLSFFEKSVTATGNVRSFFSRHSFTVYLVHMPVQMMIAGFLVAVPVSIYLRWLILLTGVLVLSVLASQGLRQMASLPIVRR